MMTPLLVSIGLAATPPITTPEAYLARKTALDLRLSKLTDDEARQKAHDAALLELRGSMLALLGERSFSRSRGSPHLSPDTLLTTDVGSDCVDGLRYHWDDPKTAPADMVLATNLAFVRAR